MKFKRFTGLVLAALIGCSSGEAPEDTTRPLLILDKDNSRKLAISALSDLEYVAKLLFDLIVQIDLEAASPGDMTPFACAEASSNYVAGPTPVGIGSQFEISGNGCDVAGSDFRGGISIELDQVNLSTDSYGGTIRFSSFTETTTARVIELDGRIEFAGVRVSSGLNAIEIDDSFLTVTKHDNMPINEISEFYQDLELFWMSEPSGEVELEIEVFVDSEAFDGSFNFVEVDEPLEREVGNSFPGSGSLLVEGASPWSYSLAANTGSDTDSITQFLDDGTDDPVDPATQPSALTWSEVFPEGFLLL